MTRFAANRFRDPSFVAAAPERAPLAFHRRLDGYARTALVELPGTSGDLGLGRILVKDESRRLGLPAFKILGASWAVYRTLLDELDPEPWSGETELRAKLAPLLPRTLVTATDGNHGRGLARTARLLGFGARVYLPDGTAPARIEAIRSEGAEAVVVAGTYDDAVERAAAGLGPADLLVQDSSWEGYEEIPRRVIEGYATIFHEIEDELRERGEPAPDLVVLPVGVGSLAAAAVAHFRRAGAAGRPLLLAVEPETAACALRSLEAGRPVAAPGPHASIMAGLNCGTLATIAWPLLRAGLDAAVAIEDGPAEEAMRALAAGGIVAGESGAAGLAALIACRAAPGDPLRTGLGLDADATALLLVTEGATDPAGYERVVGRG